MRQKIIDQESLGLSPSKITDWAFSQITNGVGSKGVQVKT